MAVLAVKRAWKYGRRVAVTARALAERPGLTMFREMRWRAVEAIERGADNTSLIRIDIKKGPYFDDHEGGTYEMTVTAWGVPR